MAETEWEKTIDNMVKENTEVLPYGVLTISRPVGSSGIGFDPLGYYQMTFAVENIGSEVTFSRLQARLVPKQDVLFFSDNNFAAQVPRIVLEWTDVGPGNIVSGVVYFRVAAPLNNVDIVRYGLYATVVPQGHFWEDLNFPDDANPVQAGSL